MHFQGQERKQLFCWEQHIIKCPGIIIGADHSKKNCPVRAIEKRIFLEQSDRITVVDPAWDTRTEYLELEVWRYDPVKFAHDSIVDSFSLALSFKGELDEAVKLNINKLLM